MGKDKVGVSEEEVAVEEEEVYVAPHKPVEKAVAAVPSPNSPIVATEEDVAMAELISETGEFDADEFDKVFLDMKKRGNYFDLIRNMYPLQLPKICEAMYERKERKYAWWGKDSMESRCDPSQMLYYTPVNANNHPMLPAHSFNKNGGLYREGLYLCFMPWRMYEARQEIQGELAKAHAEEGLAIYGKEGETADHFDPTEGGTKSGGSSGDTVYEIGEDTHPEMVVPEAGEYE